MRKFSFTKLLCILIALENAMGTLFATPTISTSSSPNVLITSSSLTGYPGTDLPSTLATTNMTVTANVATSGFADINRTWVGYCSLGTASNWPSNLVCSIKVTNAGVGTNTINASDYVQLSKTPVKLFTGSNACRNITMQIQLSNVSLANCPPVDSAAMPFIFTLNSS